jgi:hypothetical protein
MKTLMSLALLLIICLLIWLLLSNQDDHQETRRHLDSAQQSDIADSGKEAKQSPIRPVPFVSIPEQERQNVPESLEKPPSKAWALLIQLTGSHYSADTAMVSFNPVFAVAQPNALQLYPPTLRLKAKVIDNEILIDNIAYPILDIRIRPVTHSPVFLSSIDVRNSSRDNPKGCRH